MGSLIQEANEALRAAVEARREAQAAGKSAEEWYGSRGTEPLPKEKRAEGSERPGSLAFLELLEELRTLHLSKSQDYGSESDPLANIRHGADLVNIEPWRGCMVRIGDKIQRLRTYCRTGHLVHEGVRDSFLDLAAYSLLAIVLLDEERDA